MLTNKLFATGILGALVSFAGLVPPITATAGSSFVVDYDGFGGNPVHTILGLTSQVTFSNFTFTNQASYNRTRVTFQAHIENTSGGPVTGSRVSGMGFKTTPDILRSAPNSVSGVFDNVTTNGNMPNGIGRVEFCFSDVNCAGGGGGGVTLGNEGTAYATLYFRNTGITSLTFDELYVRYQSITGVRHITSASGGPVVPEPAAYVVLSAGFAIIALRRLIANPTKRR